MRRLLVFVFVMIVGLAAAPTQAGIKTVRVASGLTNPLYATAPAGDYDRLFIVEQFTARIKILNLGTGTVNGTPYLDINSKVINTGNERGLLGLAFHPAYLDNGLFYVNYSNNSGDTVIAEYQVSANPDIADIASERIVMTIDQPQSNHNGGWIGFGPNDGYLYIATGDGGNFCDTGTGHTPGTGNSQDTSSNLLGKILRIDVDGSLPYEVPSSNPFVGGLGDDEIWAYGLRNPWRCSFDRVTGDFYLGDVGQDLKEEIDYQPSSSTGGENYGWRCEEGTSCATSSPSSCGATTGCNCPATTLGLVPPIHDFSHTSPPPPAGFVCSVTGGYVYRGCALPELDGHYLFADYCGDAVWSFKVVGGSLTSFMDRTSDLSPSDGGHFVTDITSFGEDAYGEIYIVDRGGEIFKIVSTDPPAVDCNSNGIEDACDILASDGDCNANGILDSCDITSGFSTDGNVNGRPDECDFGYTPPPPGKLGGIRHNN